MYAFKILILLTCVRAEDWTFATLRYGYRYLFPPFAVPGYQPRAQVDPDSCSAPGQSDSIKQAITNARILAKAGLAAIDATDDNNQAIYNAFFQQADKDTVRTIS